MLDITKVLELVILLTIFIVCILLFHWYRQLSPREKDFILAILSSAHQQNSEYEHQKQLQDRQFSHDWDMQQQQMQEQRRQQDFLLKEWSRIHRNDR